jgi:hypothetical protein
MPVILCQLTRCGLVSARLKRKSSPVSGLGLLPRLRGLPLAPTVIHLLEPLASIIQLGFLDV